MSRLRRGAAAARGDEEGEAGAPPAGAGGPATEPFIATVRRELAAQEHRRSGRRRWALRAAAVALALVALHFAVTRILYGEPTAAALRAYADALVPPIVAAHSTPLQPLAPAGAAVQLIERVGADRLRYTVEITLRLSEPLYAPANSNGTAEYRQLQQALETAREHDLEHKLLGERGLDAPQMPLLLQVVHRPGERVVVRVPFEAKRFGWAWRLEPAPVALGRADRVLEGAVLRQYANVPTLMYGAPGTWDEVRRLSELARGYISAVAKEVQKRADAEALGTVTGVARDRADGAGPTGTPQGGSAAAAVVDPDAPAVAASPAAIDPDAPAVEPTPTPAP